jgi:hypothetical protein
MLDYPTPVLTDWISARSVAIGFYRREWVKRDPRGTSDRPANDSDSEWLINALF